MDMTLDGQPRPAQAGNSLRGKVVVITGASSGLGRAAAIQFASAGCEVVVASRRVEALEEVARACRESGGSASCHVTDVTVEDDVHRLARATLSRTGRIDIWVNNAGVTCLSRLEDGSFDEHRRVLETNLFGAIYGARAAIPIFRRQGRGVLINVGSVLSKIGQPFVPSYVISKFGVRGLSEALRAEVADQPEISICSLLPYAMDTQHFEAAANHYGRPAHPMPPLQSPEKVARVLVDLAAHPKRERHVPRAAVLGLALHALFPQGTERVIREALERWHFGTAPQADTAGNLFEAEARVGAVHGSRRPTVSSARLIPWALMRLCAAPFSLARRRLGGSVGPGALAMLARLEREPDTLREAQGRPFANQGMT